MLAQRTLGSHLSLPGREGLSVQDLATNDLRTLATLYGEQNAGTCDHSTLSAYIEKQAYESSKHWRVQDIKVRNSIARSDKAVLDCNSPTQVVVDFFRYFAGCVSSTHQRTSGLPQRRIVYVWRLSNGFRFAGGP